jgi:hypothetical protein
VEAAGRESRLSSHVAVALDALYQVRDTGV